MTMRIFERFSSRHFKSAKRVAEEVEILHNSALLDPIWYRQTYLDLRETPVDVARPLPRIWRERGAQSSSPLRHEVLSTARSGCGQFRNEPARTLYTIWYETEARSASVF